MTDNEIIKALECCCAKENCEVVSCEKCPLEKHYECTDIMFHETVDLINRQKAEIENLNVELVGMRGACESYKMHYDNAQAEIKRLQKEGLQLNKTFMDFVNVKKSEAIKEFANLIKRRLNSNTSRGAYLIDIVDNLVKEMTEESENG